MDPITLLSAADFDASVPGLGGLLAEVVAGGASLGFLAPFGPDDAADWWRARHPVVSDGSLLVWVAGRPADPIGTVSLALERKPNGRHRAEVLKLMVRPAARGRGLARTLLATAEHAAARTGAGLLMLDTVTGSAADRLYTGAGWTRYGTVPDYAADPSGTLEECSFYYKSLR